MTSTIKVNNIQNQCGANIINENSDTITIGASGDTIALASGASQSGFGRTGTVDWQTGSIKTATFTAANGEGYFANTTGGAFNLTLPSSPSAGNIVAVADYANTFNTNNLTIARNGSNIEGAASDLVLNQQGVSISLVYVDATKGWIVVNAGNSSQGFGQNFICATGGTITEDGNFRIHTFTGPGTFTVCSVATSGTNNVVSYAVVAGGGSGGSMGGGGGGAGGFREYKSPVDAYSASPLDGNPGGTEITVTAQAYPITVGAGGVAGCASPPNRGTIGLPGNPSTFSTVTSTAGGGGGARMQPCQSPNSRAGLAGGSGGGAARDSGPSDNSGAGNTPPVSPSQGFKGGKSTSNSAAAAGGGGGATSAGANGTTCDSSGPGSTGTAGPGGNGATSAITGSPVTRAGGGGGGSNNANPPLRGIGGPGGGGSGGQDGTDGGSCNPATAGTTNTGGGGGGGSQKEAGTGSAKGGNGGSGVVIIRYKFQ